MITSTRVVAFIVLKQKGSSFSVAQNKPNRPRFHALGIFLLPLRNHVTLLLSHQSFSTCKNLVGTVNKVYWSYLLGCHMHPNYTHTIQCVPVGVSPILWLEITKTACGYHCVVHYKAVIAFSQKEKKNPCHIPGGQVYLPSGPQKGYKSDKFYVMCLM